MDYLFVTAATVLLAGEFAFSKKYQAMEGTTMAAGLRFNALAGLLTALIMWAIRGFRVEWSWFSFAMAMGMSLCALSYSLLSFRVLKSGGMALYSTFLMSGGMVLPYLFGVLFLEEQLTALRVAGLVLILGAVILSNFSKHKLSVKLLLLCAAVFVLNGLVSILSKCHQVSTVPGAVDSTGFVLYSGVAKCLLSTLALLFVPGGKRLIKPRVGFVVAGAAVIGAASYLLQLIGARTLPASVLYPMVTGGSIIFSAVAGWLFFKERISRQQLVSILLCFVGTLLFL